VILLDTDHRSVYMDERDPRHGPLNDRLEAADEPIACYIVSVEEMFRGWLAVIHRLNDIRRQLPSYHRFGRIIDVLGEWEIMPFDERAADEFSSLRRRRIRIGTMDLKIASIALAHDARRVTANDRDFGSRTCAARIGSNPESDEW
jgi:tRNA(fMet)-specific endonuclease VapC